VVDPQGQGGDDLFLDALRWRGMPFKLLSAHSRTSISDWSLLRPMLRQSDGMSVAPGPGQAREQIAIGVLIACMFFAALALSGS
jgi:hypothetical protein